MESRDRWMAGLRYPEGGLEFLVADLQSWTPGQVVRVAFLGGSPQLYQAIEEASRPISQTANIVLDFKRGGSYRTWSTSDTEYAAEIRVSFDERGYCSLVGTDSINPHIGLPGQPMGGAPHQRSLNLGGFSVARPASWEGTTRHEFLHALGLHHEHQNMRGPCQAAFRWEDDLGYQPTRDRRGAYITDANGLRPGIYTYLSGYPNGWPRSKVDFNLRTPSDSSSLVSGPFDPSSIMLYRFPELFYRTQPSPCAPSGPASSSPTGTNAVSSCCIRSEHNRWIPSVSAGKDCWKPSWDQQIPTRKEGSRQPARGSPKSLVTPRRVFVPAWSNYDAEQFSARGDYQDHEADGSWQA